MVRKQLNAASNASSMLLGSATGTRGTGVTVGMGPGKSTKMRGFIIKNDDENYIKNHTLKY